MLALLCRAAVDGHGDHDDRNDAEQATDEGNDRQQGPRVADRRLLRSRLGRAGGAVHAQAEQLLARRPALRGLEGQEVKERQEAGEQPREPVAGKGVREQEEQRRNEADDDAVDDAGAEAQAQAAGLPAAGGRAIGARVAVLPWLRFEVRGRHGVAPAAVSVAANLPPTCQRAVDLTPGESNSTGGEMKLRLSAAVCGSSWPACEPAWPVI